MSLQKDKDSQAMNEDQEAEIIAEEKMWHYVPSKLHQLKYASENPDKILGIRSIPREDYMHYVSKLSYSARKFGCWDEPEVVYYYL